MAILGENRYGKSRVRVMRVDRDGEQHRLSEWNVDVWLKGSFEDCFESGDNSRILPTDTMKNTVYSLARSSHAETVEQFAVELATHFVSTQEQVAEAGTSIRSMGWHYIQAEGETFGNAFVQSSGGYETVTAVAFRGATPTITSGIADLPILKTAKSGFSGYVRDHLTTLKETQDRLFGTLATIDWTYALPVADFRQTRVRITEAILGAFARHDSLSVQHTLFAMGQAALEAEPAIGEIHLKMPNKHCNLVDLSAFGQDNPNHIFVPTDEPHGSIEACIRRAE